MDRGSWAPVNETASDIWTERSILDGLFLGAATSGIHFTLFIWAFYLLWSGKRTQSHKLFLIYISVVFVLGNIGNGTALKYGEMIFIDARNYPGGPDAFYVEQSMDPVSIVCNATYIASNWLLDGLLLYRLWMIFQKSLYIIGLPTLMFLASFTLSLLLIVELTRPDITLWSKSSVDLTLAFGIISITFNIVITIFISARLLYMRNHIRRTIPGSGEDYVSITAMLIESACLYTVCGIFSVIGYAMNSPIQNLGLPLVGQAQSIATLLIIIRVAQGRAWTSDTMSRIHFETSRSDLPPNFRLVAEPSITTPHGLDSNESVSVLQSNEEQFVIVPNPMYCE